MLKYVIVGDIAVGWHVCDGEFGVVGLDCGADGRSCHVLCVWSFEALTKGGDVLQEYNGDDYQGGRIVSKACALRDAVCIVTLFC